MAREMAMGIGSDKGLRQHLRRAVAGLLAAVVLLAVLGLYTRPEFMVMMAEQVWSCMGSP